MKTAPSVKVTRLKAWRRRWKEIQKMRAQYAQVPHEIRCDTCREFYIPTRDCHGCPCCAHSSD